MKKEYTHAELETKFKQKYYGKYVSFQYPGYTTIYGMVDQVGVEVLHDQVSLILMINQHRYKVSLESIHECLKLLNGHTSGS